MTVLILAFAIICLMNLVTGTFVDKAIDQSNKVKQSYQMDRARKFFSSLDFSDSGRTTRPDIMQNLQSRAVQQFFKSIDSDEIQADILFNMLDIDASGEIQVSEFLEGCTHLQAPARLANMLLVA